MKQYTHTCNTVPVLHGWLFKVHKLYIFVYIWSLYYMVVDLKYINCISLYIWMKQSTRTRSLYYMVGYLKYIYCIFLYIKETKHTYKHLYFMAGCLKYINCTYLYILIKQGTHIRTMVPLLHGCLLEVHKLYKFLYILMK